MRQAGQQAARVAGRDPVAVGVLDVVEGAVGVEGRNLAILLGQGIVAAAERLQRPVIARLGEVRIVVAVIGLEARCEPPGPVMMTVPSDSTESDVCHGSDQPMPNGPIRLRPVIDGVKNRAKLRDRVPGVGPRHRRRRRVADRAEAIGLLDLEAEELADVGDVLAQSAEVCRVRVECSNVVAVGRRRPRWRGWRRAFQAVRSMLGGREPSRSEFQSMGVVLSAWSTPRLK